MKVLNLSNNNLTHLPRSWFDCPNQLETLILNGNLIGGLNPSLASCFGKLKHLSLKQNRFERLRKPSDTRKISKGDSVKETDGLKLFSDHKRIIWPRSYKSGYKDEKVSRGRHDYAGVIPPFKRLETLDLSYNKISSISQIPLSSLENLSRLNLSNNKLSNHQISPERECDFGSAPFYTGDKPGLTELDLSHNSDLARVHSCWTFGLHRLQSLILTNCSISVICDSSFDKMKSLTILDLSYNKLSSVPKELTAITKSLTWLSLAYNNISQRTSFYLSSLENIRFLNLSHNQYQSLIVFPISESVKRLSDNVDELPLIATEDSSNEESRDLLHQMQHLQEIDLSFNDLIKVSAISDLAPSIKWRGALQRVDLRGNEFIRKFSDFNASEITSTLREFLINVDQRLDCDCSTLGFINWIKQRNIKVSGKCASPQHLLQFSITDSQLPALIQHDNSCKDITTSTLARATYRLKLFSNANQSVELTPSSNDPMEEDQKKATNHKLPVNSQKWVMIGSNLTLRCEFFSTYSIETAVSIEWQRYKLRPVDNVRHGMQDTHQNNRHFLLKNDNAVRSENIKFVEKIEHLNSNFDPRIKITQIGPADKDSINDHFFNSEESPNAAATHYGYQYVSILLLEPILLSDMGRYRCLINGLPTINWYGQNQPMSKDQNIKVFEPPRFTTIPSNPMSIIEGETAKIACRAVGIPTPMTSFGQIGSKDFPAARGRRMIMFKDDSSFFITNVSQIDAGDYSCTSRNAAGVICHNFTLKVQMAATILNHKQLNKTVLVGDSLIIGFKVGGVPMPEVKWFKNGHRIIEDDRIRFSSDHLMLVIQSTVLTDAGLYRMSALNALGGNDALVSVNILDSVGYSSRELPVQAFTDKVQKTNDDLSFLPDYWLSAIIIIVILSILLTSILWITIFFCVSKIICSKRRRLLLVTNSQTRSNFDKAPKTITTSFSNPQLMANDMPLFKPLTHHHLPLTMTTSTIAGHDQDNIDIGTFTGSTETMSELYSPRYSSQPYHSLSRMDLSVRVPHHHGARTVDQSDSGIDTSLVYSELTPANNTVYQCRPKSKHRAAQHQRSHQQHNTDSAANITNYHRSFDDYNAMLLIADQTTHNFYRS